MKKRRKREKESLSDFKVHVLSVLDTTHCHILLVHGVEVKGDSHSDPVQLYFILWPA